MFSCAGWATIPSGSYCTDWSDEPMMVQKRRLETFLISSLSIHSYTSCFFFFSHATRGRDTMFKLEWSLITHRNREQDSSPTVKVGSPTPNLETVHRQNRRQFTDTFENSSLTLLSPKSVSVNCLVCEVELSRFSFSLVSLHLFIGQLDHTFTKPSLIWHSVFSAISQVIWNRLYLEACKANDGTTGVDMMVTLSGLEIKGAGQLAPKTTHSKDNSHKDNKRP